MPECRLKPEIEGVGMGANGEDTNLSLLLASALAAFFAAYLFLPWLIRSLHGTSLVGKDLNKSDRPLVPEMGGLGVILGFYVGVGVLVIGTSNEVPSSFYYASLVATLGAGTVGLMDDMFGLRRRMKALLPFLLAFPLGAAVNASGDTMILGVDFGLLTVILIPLGITSAANAANMLEGFNGLGAGMGVIMCFALIGLAFITGETQGLYLIIPLLGALLAFLWFNKYPARVFPGDSMTLFMGAAIAAAAIISKQKMFGALLFLPMIVEFALKFRGGLQAENYGTPDGDGRLRYEGPVESLTHIIMRRYSLKEWQVVGALWAIEVALACAILLAAVIS